MRFIERNLSLIAVTAVAALMLLPFLGLTDFNTKGEPREAVVALSMLKDGDWILPVNNGADIPYKPPFFHWCIAALSLLTGSVSEYTSRLPSALALIAMTAGCFAFWRKRTGVQLATAGALLMLTSFEVHRAGVNCRVDMVLTAFTVGAMLLFYRWRERGSRGVPVWAVLCMSGAVLTKGPVGFLVPCLVMGLFSLMRGDSFRRTLLSYAGFALLSCVLPAAWYVAAWREGGQPFLDLVYEENIGRMTGTMSYESHVNPFYYNFLTLIAGWLPWTLLLLFSLASKPWSALRRRTNGGAGAVGGWKARVERVRVRLMQVPPVTLFTWTGFLAVLFFYCLPSSKRSVYLLPCYPFMAMLLARYIEWLWQTRRRGTLRSYTIVVAVLMVAVSAAFAAIRMGYVPETIFHGKHAEANLAMLRALRDTPLNLWMLLMAVVPATAGLYAICSATLDRYTRATMYYCLFMPAVSLFVALDGFFQPLVLNTKSLRPLADYISRTFPDERVYQHVESPMMHLFGADFYLGDTMGQFETYTGVTGNSSAAFANRSRREMKTPSSGVLVIPANDFAALAARHSNYRFTLVHTTRPGAAEVKEPVAIYRFRATDMKPQ